MAWSEKDIKRRISLLKKKLKYTANETDKEKISQTISSLYDILDYFKSEIFEFKYSLKFIINQDKEFIQKMKLFNPFILEFADKYSMNSPVLDYETDLKINTTEESILKLTKDFYESIKDDRFNIPFKELYSKKNTLVNFRKKLFFKKQENEAVSFGIYNTKDVYLLINKLGLFSDYLASIHEYGHGISFLINQDFSIDDSKHLFIESDAIFFELLGNDYIGNYENLKTKALTSDIERFYDYVYYAVVIQCKIGLHTYFNNLDNVSKHDIINYLNNHMQIEDEDIINSVLREPMENIYRYVISYLLAIELYYSYKDDSKKALNALYKLISMDCNCVEDFLAILRNEYEIELGKNIYSYYSSLINRVKEVQNDQDIQHRLK